MRFGSRNPHMRRSRSRVDYDCSRRDCSPGRRCLHEHVFDAGQLRDFGLCDWVAVSSIGNDLVRRRAGPQYPLGEAFGHRLVAVLLRQDVEFGAMLIGAPCALWDWFGLNRGDQVSNLLVLDDRDAGSPNVTFRKCRPLRSVTEYDKSKWQSPRRSCSRFELKPALWVLHEREVQRVDRPPYFDCLEIDDKISLLV